jgi:hypothetical protein
VPLSPEEPFNRVHSCASTPDQQLHTAVLSQQSLPISVKIGATAAPTNLSDACSCQKFTRCQLPQVGNFRPQLIPQTAADKTHPDWHITTSTAPPSSHARTSDVTIQAVAGTSLTVNG